nr:uncharacterized protein LOC100204625 [Hydra vulgaris]XP_012555334.2 uncharacterized protein LOC100204625 [Hydra vulgaris]
MSQDTFVTLRVNKQDYASKLDRRGSWSNFESSLKKVPSSVGQFLSKSSSQSKTPPIIRKNNEKSTRDALWLSSNLLNNVTAELCYTKENETDKCIKNPLIRPLNSSSFRSEINPIIRVIEETVTTDASKSDKKRLCKSSSSEMFPLKHNNDELKSKSHYSDTFTIKHQNDYIRKKSCSSETFPTKLQNNKIKSKSSDTFLTLANNEEIKNECSFSDTLPTKLDNEETRIKCISSDTLSKKRESDEISKCYSSDTLQTKPNNKEVGNKINSSCIFSNPSNIFPNSFDIVPTVLYNKVENQNNFSETILTNSHNKENKCAKKISDALEIVKKSKLPNVLVSRIVFGNSKTENGSYLNGWNANFFEESKVESNLLNEKSTDNIIDNIILESVILETLKKSTVMMTYDPVLSINRAQHISKELVETVKKNLFNEKSLYKVVAQVFLGALKDNGFYFATQCSFEPNGDLFASSIVNTNDMFVCAIVKAEKCVLEDI